MITTIFTQWKELWKLRNQDRHGKDYKDKADVAYQQAVTELMMMMYKLKDYCFLTIDEFLRLHSISSKTRDFPT